MSDLILQPPKLYLDTCHLVRLTRLRKGQAIQDQYLSAYKKLDECICDRHFGLIFSPWAPLEWVEGNATLETALEIADVVESAALQYEIESDSYIHLHEVLCELKRVSPSICVPDFEILFLRSSGSVRRPLAVLINECPAYFDENELPAEGWQLPQEIPFGPIREHVERAWHFRFNSPNVYQERIDGYKAAIDQDLETFGNRQSKAFTSDDRNQWIKRYLRIDRIFDVLNPTVNLDELLVRIEIQRCPATNLHLSAYEHRIRSGHIAKPNDEGDWAYLPFIPYADVVLSERSLAHFVRQADIGFGARVTHDPNRALEILQPWLSD